MLVYFVLINGIIKEKKLFKEKRKEQATVSSFLTADRRHIESACNGTD